MFSVGPTVFCCKMVVNDVIGIEIGCGCIRSYVNPRAIFLKA